MAQPSHKGLILDGLNNTHYNYTGNLANEQKHKDDRTNFSYNGQSHLTYASLHHALVNENSTLKVLLSTVEDEENKKLHLKKNQFQN